jgi:putative RecB family exonuclease
MMSTALRDSEERSQAEAAPHLSYSSLQKYLTCPEQYRLHYVMKLRPKFESAGLVFGSVMHLALADYFRRKADLIGTFLQDWDGLKSVPLRFSRRESWEKLRDIGQKLLAKFASEEARKIGRVFSVEASHTLGVSNLSLPFVGVTDLVAEMDGKRTLIDFKTAATDFDDSEVALLDQVTAYTMAEPEIEQIAICVLVKTKEPQIRWHKTSRTPAQLVEYLAKAEVVASQIERQVFYKRVGMWCRQCDFVPVCAGNRKEADAKLAQIV